jgi:hypothetical protein
MANTALAPGQTYAGRNAKLGLIQLWIDKAALAFIKEQALTSKGLSRYVERLIFQEMIRVEERHGRAGTPADD